MSGEIEAEGQTTEDQTIEEDTEVITKRKGIFNKTEIFKETEVIEEEDQTTEEVPLKKVSRITKSQSNTTIIGGDLIEEEEIGFKIEEGIGE